MRVYAVKKILQSTPLCYNKPYNKKSGNNRVFPSGHNIRRRNGLRISSYFCVQKKYLATEVLKKQGYKDSNLEMTESESVALPFGDSPLPCDKMYNTLSQEKSQHLF